jgi:putative FmdB family regulatory protein
MPTYEYTCLKCGHAFEKAQSIKSDALATCPKELCPKKPWGKGKVKRAVGGGAALIFKGSGFYITDYRSDKYKDAARKDSAGGSSDSGKKEKGAAAGGSAGSGSAPAPAPASPAAPAPPKKS